MGIHNSVLYMGDKKDQKNKGIYQAQKHEEELKKGIMGLKICEDCGGLCTESVPIMEGLPVNAQVSLMEHSVHETLRKNSYLFREGEPVDSICIIRKGRVKLCRYDSLGREQIITILADHDIIWEGMFLDGSIYPYSAVCLTNASICQIHRDRRWNSIRRRCFCPHRQLFWQALLHLSLWQGGTRRWRFWRGHPQRARSCCLRHPCPLWS